MSEALTVDFALTGVSAVAGGFSQVAAVSGRADTRIRALSKSVKAAVSDLKALNTHLVRYNQLSRAGGASGVAAAARPSAQRPSVAPEAASRLRGGRSSVAAGPVLREQAMGREHGPADTHAHGGGAAPAPSRKPGGRLLDAAKPGGLEGSATGLLTEALGSELSAVAGPVGLLVGAAGGAAKGLHDLAASAAAVGTGYNDRANALGNSGATGAAVGGLAGVDGVGEARAYNSAISGGGLGTYAGYREGQFNLNNPMVSKMDIGKQYWDAMEARRKMPHDEQLRQAAMTHTEGSMGLMSMSDQQWQIAKQQGLAQSKIMDGTAGPSVDFQQSEAGLKAATDNLTAALGQPLLKPLTDFENGLAGATTGIASWLSTATGKAITGAVLGPLASAAGSGAKGLGLAATVAGGVPGAILGAMGASGGNQATPLNGNSFQSAAPLDGTGAVAANTAALQANTASHRELAKSMPGVFGAQDSSGRRAGALPSEANPDGNHPGRIMGLIQLMKANVPLSQFA